MNDPFKHSILAPLIALFCGMATATAFAPLSWYPFALIAPAVLLFILLYSSPLQAFSRGFLFGMGLFGVGISWVYVSIHTFGQAPLPLAVLVTLGIVCYLALFIGLLGYILQALPTRRPLAKCLLLFPALWVVLEWFRGWLFSGFPWLFLGYSQISTALRGYAPFCSVYGVSLVVALMSGCIVSIFVAQRFSSKSLVLLGILSIWLLGMFLDTQNWTHPSGKPLVVTLVQGNTPQAEKWLISKREAIIQSYEKLSYPHWHKSDLIVWPEAAIPALPEDVMLTLNSLDQMANANHTEIFVGIPVVNTFTGQYYNAIKALGEKQGEYHKRHLVPFGEYFPGKYLLSWFFSFFNIPMSDFSAGREDQPLLWANNTPIAPYICYEIAFPREVLNTIKNAMILLTITDDSWFGHSFAVAQHLEIAQMRSLETGRPGLFASNTGITAFISADGQIDKQAEPDIQTTLSQLVQPMTGRTFIMHIGLLPLAIVAGIMIALALLL